MSPRLKFQIEKFSLQFLQEDRYNAAGGMMKLDLTLLPTVGLFMASNTTIWPNATPPQIIGGLTTYLVILIQFDAAGRDNTHHSTRWTNFVHQPNFGRNSTRRQCGNSKQSFLTESWWKDDDNHQLLSYTVNLFFSLLLVSDITSKQWLSIVDGNTLACNRCGRNSQNKNHMFFKANRKTKRKTFVLFENE